MHCQSNPLGPSSRSLLAVLSGLVMFACSPVAYGASAVSSAEDEAAAACIQTARRTLSSKKDTRSAEVSFPSAPTVQPGLTSERQFVLSGEGRWRDASGVRHVKFICNVDRHTLETTGLVIQDAAPLVARAAPAHKPPAEPDLSHLSIAACESSAVQALQKRWPYVSDITFESTTRSFKQDTLERAELHGEGRASPAQGKPTTYFGFECEIDPRDGRIVRMRVSG